MTRTTSFVLSVAVAAALLLPVYASGQTSNPTPTQCQSKWVAAGNNGAKADRYYRPHCQ